MLDDLDALGDAAREADRKKRRRAPKPPERVKISYWSKAENRFKTRTTTCMFKPDPPTK